MVIVVDFLGVVFVFVFVADVGGIIVVVILADLLLLIADGFTLRVSSTQWCFVSSCIFNRFG